MQDNTEVLSPLFKGGASENEWIRKIILDNQLKIRSFIFRNNGSESDFEDVFQQGVTELVVNIRKGKFKGESTVGTYLYAICKGIWYKKFQRDRLQDKYLLQKETEEVDFVTPECNLINEEMKQKIDGLLSVLKSKCKDLLIMWSKKYKMAEIATALGYSNPQVAMNKKNHCLKELRSIVAANPGVRQEFKDWLNG